jgi:predicted ArsR family transcriptional regulator
MEKRRRDLPVTLYRILLYLSRMRERGDDSRRLMRIERAVGVERKELRLHLQRMHEAGYIIIEERELRGRGGHPVLVYSISENGRTLRSDIGRWIDLSVRMGYYPDAFFYLPSDQ